MDRKLYKEIRAVWEKINYKYYWGSNIDIRFKLIDLVKGFKNKIILDIGGAPGVIDYFIEQNNFVVCIDINKERLLESKKILKQTRLIIADWNNLPFKKSKFDIIIMANIIELDRNLIDNLESKLDLLKDNGLIFITTVNNKSIRYKKSKKIFNTKNIIQGIKKYNYIIKPWNPFPPFPFFFPNKIIHKIPFIWNLLEFCYKKNLFLNSSQFFYIIIKKD